MAVLEVRGDEVRRRFRKRFEHRTSAGCRLIVMSNEV